MIEGLHIVDEMPPGCVQIEGTIYSKDYFRAMGTFAGFPDGTYFRLRRGEFGEMVIEQFGPTAGEMIEINERNFLWDMRFDLWADDSSMEDKIGMREQLYSQMMGWA